MACIGCQRRKEWLKRQAEKAKRRLKGQETKKGEKEEKGGKFAPFEV